MDLPLTSVVMDMAHESIGVLVANYAAGYRHPTAEGHILSPTNYAAAPLAEWSISASGALVPPPEMAEYIGDKPEPARLAQLRDRRQAATRPPAAPPQRARVILPQRHVPSSHYETRDDPAEQQRANEAIARIFGRS